MKRKKKKRRALKIIFIMVLIVMSALILKYMVFEETPKNKYNIEATIHTNSTNYQYGIYKNQVIIYENNELKLYDQDIEKKYAFKNEISDADLHSIGNAIYVTDKANGDIYVFDKSGAIINSISLSKTILSIKADVSKEYIGFHTKDANGTEQLVFFNGEGQETGQIFGVKDGKIIDFSFDAVNRKVAISAITYENSLKTNIMLVDIEGNILSGKTINNEIYAKIFLTNDESIICIGDRKVIKINNKKEIEWSKNIEADDALYSSEGLILTRSQIGKTNIIMIDEANNTLLETTVGDKIEKIKSSNRKTILYGKGTLYELSKGELTETKLSKDILWVDILMNGKIVIGNNRKVEILSDY